VGTRIHLVLGVGVFIVWSAARWFNIWIGLEIAVVSYLGVLVANSNAVTILLYFVAQVFGSFLILISAVGDPSGQIAWLLIVALCIKIGYIIGHLWASVFILSVRGVAVLWFLAYLKVGPLWLSGGFLPIYILAGFTACVGLGALGSTLRLERFVIWSGLARLPWLWFCSTTVLLLTYFFVYRVVVFFLFNFRIRTGMLIFSLSGIPPFPLFGAKILLLSGCLRQSVVLVLCGGIALVLYSRWLTLTTNPNLLHPQLIGWGCIYLLLF